jgi:hypothetical protein
MDQIQKKRGAQMKNARPLLEEFIASPFRDPKQAASMFAADGRLVSESGKIKCLREAALKLLTITRIWVCLCWI